MTTESPTALTLAERARSDDGYRLWLRYALVGDLHRLAEYRSVIRCVHFPGDHPTLRAARDELDFALEQFLGVSVPFVPHADERGTLILGTPETNEKLAALGLARELSEVGDEGYLIQSSSSSAVPVLVVAANTEIGVLYGVFALLRLLATHSNLEGVSIVSKPRVLLRMLDHWDNLDRTIERGYAGSSLWDWHKLPDYLSPRYVDYARANASIGINAVALTNVNANALILTDRYLDKVCALADVFRPYGIRVFLTARFNAPMELDDYETADPTDARVVEWWRRKVKAIYQRIHDFGGFLVKANSEGQPGPQDYGHSQAVGANLLASALEPHGGTVIWRAFVYDDEVEDDRAKQAYSELVPLDGEFAKNACLQTKNGPIDFQPREPFHPLFGAMPKTPMLVEFQLTQEYLGLATHLAYLAPLFKETLDADTHVAGAGSTVARVIDGSVFGQHLTGMAAVANIGDERNWCGHPFAAANWYAFGRLAWDHQNSSDAIAEEWLRMTFVNDDEFIASVVPMMEASRETVVNYMTPLGLHHIMAWNHHYGPGPWIAEGRRDWTSVYYHRADSGGVGFDRTSRGSDAVSQYSLEVARVFDDVSTCPENLLLWFHHVPYDHVMKSGRTLWEEMCLSYQRGVDAVRGMQRIWNEQRGRVDPGRYEHVRALLKVQLAEAVWWKDACLLYFQTFSKLPWPDSVDEAAQSLDYYQALEHHYVPGI